MTRKTVLIFGVSSFLGSNLAEDLLRDYRVVGTYYDTPVHIPGVLSLKCDIHNKDIVEKIVYLFKPDFTIYAVGLTNLFDCQDYPKVADALNTVGVFNASGASERHNSKFIYFSSGYIFSGEDTLYREQDTPMPSSIYGNNVASSEFYIQKSCLNYLIFRSCPIYGRSYNPNALNWLEVLERSTFLGENIVCDDNVHTGFLDVESITKVLRWAMEKNITNRLFQISSSDIMTRYEFAKLYFEVFGGNDVGISKGNWQFPRSENQVTLQSIGDELFFRMDTTNIEIEYGHQLPSIKKTLQNFHNKLSRSAKSGKRSGKGGDVVFI